MAIRFRSLGKHAVDVGTIVESTVAQTVALMNAISQFCSTDRDSGHVRSWEPCLLFSINETSASLRHLMMRRVW
jgi:hypothetical protein